jgi:exosortase family protein XrtF
MGYDIIPQGLFGEGIRTAGIDGSHGVWVGDPCNGLTLFALFTGFVLAFPGPVVRKLWFIPVGIITIHILNVLRVTCLAIIQYYTPQYLEFNHTYTFTILVYSYVFVLWYVWAARLSKS